jgi:putative membrane protein
MEGVMVRAALILVASIAFAQAQQQSPAETIQGSMDAQFAVNTWLDGMAEVELGNLARTHASDARVKQFAQRMITDHTKANEQLGGIARTEQVSLPTQLDGAHAALKRTLTGMTGQAFDREYMNAMVDNHKLAVASFEKQAAEGRDEPLKRFAAQTLPTLKDHLKMAEDIQHAVTGQSGE